MWNSRYATIDVHILGIFHPDCNIPEQTPPEGNCMITADKKQEKYTLKTSLGLFSLVGGYSEAACCWFFFEQFWVVDTNAENSWAEEPLNAIFCSENVGGGAEPGELCALVFRVCITFKRAQKTLSFEELLKALVGSDKPVKPGPVLFYTSNSESISAWQEGKHVLAASPKAPGEALSSKHEGGWCFVCRVWAECVPSWARLPFGKLQFYQNNSSRSALLDTASLKSLGGNLDNLIF